VPIAVATHLTRSVTPTLQNRPERRLRPGKSSLLADRGPLEGGVRLVLRDAVDGLEEWPVASLKTVLVGAHWTEGRAWRIASHSRIV